MANEVLSSIKKMQPAKTWANILSYTIMPEGALQRTDHDFAWKLACQNRGVWTDIPRPDEPDTSAYMALMALPAEFRNSGGDFVYFSPVYEDTSNLGNVVSVSTGYYSKCEGNSVGPKKVLLGVVGVDIKVVDLQRAGILEKYVEFQNHSIHRGLSIRNVKELGCQLQVWNSHDSIACCANFGCPLQILQYN